MASSKLGFKDYIQVAWPLALIIGVSILTYKQNHGGLAISRAVDAAAQTPLTGVSLAGFQITSASGQVMPLTPKGGGVLMLASSTCGHCLTSLASLAESAGPTRTLPKLRLVVFQSAAAGVLMLANSQLSAEAVGPHGDPNQLLKAFQTAGTPTFLWVDANGRVLDKHVGALSGPIFATWLARTKGA